MLDVIGACYRQQGIVQDDQATWTFRYPNGARSHRWRQEPSSNTGVYGRGECHKALGRAIN
ncbi:MAG: hypothetical protein KME27_17200 [Lyngbya sp. HA4199-MV5]|nr:hypothetical protein [Lyngbya sp. HA4199-MV5]